MWMKLGMYRNKYSKYEHKRYEYNLSLETTNIIRGDL